MELLSIWLVPPQYTKCFEQLRRKWSPIITKFDMDLVCAPRKSQLSQFSNSLPSPTTHTTFYQFSQLEHCDNYPAPANHHSWTKASWSHYIWMLTPFSPATPCRRRRQESHSSLPPPLPLTLHINAPPHIRMSGPTMLLSTPYHCSPFMTLLIFVY